MPGQLLANPGKVVRRGGRQGEQFGAVPVVGLADDGRAREYSMRVATRSAQAVVSAKIAFRSKSLSFGNWNPAIDGGGLAKSSGNSNSGRQAYPDCTFCPGDFVRS